jgi:hypothetical protein
MAPFWPALSVQKTLLSNRLQKNHHALHEHTTRFDGIVIGRSDMAVRNQLFSSLLRKIPHAVHEQNNGRRAPAFGRATAT